MSMDRTQKALESAEAFGLKLPLKYRGARMGRTYQACPGAPIQAAESCDACGQSIKEVHVFHDAAGAEFKTGCDCVYRYLPAAYHGVVKREHNKLEKAKRDARNAKRREVNAKKAAKLRAELDAEISARASELAEQPHPTAWAADKGETRLDWAMWMLKNGGAAAHTKTLKELRA